MPLPVCPCGFLKTGYSVTHASGVISNTTEGGLSRSRADILGGPRYIPGQFFSKTEADYQTLMFFYYTLIQEGALPFEVTAYGISETEASSTVEAKIVPNTFKSRKSGEGWVTSMTLEVML